MITAIRATPGGRDAYGDPVESTSRRHRLDDCFVGPRVSSDTSERGRSGVVVGLSLYGPLGTDLVATDQVDVDGTVYDIDGEIGSYESPFSGFGGIEVALKRAAG